MHLQDQVLMMLHFLAHQGKYGLLSDRFGLTRSCYHRCVDDLLNIVVQQLQKFISWPDAHRHKETADYFHNKFAFPGVIGSIDGTHITVARPPGEFFLEDYFSVRKKIYTMLLQVCHETKFWTPPEATGVFCTCVRRVLAICAKFRTPLPPKVMHCLLCACMLYVHVRDSDCS